MLIVSNVTSSILYYILQILYRVKYKIALLLSYFISIQYTRYSVLHNRNELIAKIL